MDLLRCIIIGPSGTPFVSPRPSPQASRPPLTLLPFFSYVDAPHLIDFYLDPQKFPFEPPKAFFHSWTRGPSVLPRLPSE